MFKLFILRYQLELSKTIMNNFSLIKKQKVKLEAKLATSPV